MSDSVQPHRLQPTRSPRPWDSPGKNWSGLPFPSPMHESESEVAQSCPTLLDPMDCSLPGSSIHGIFQARVLEWGAIAFSSLKLLALEGYKVTKEKNCNLTKSRFVWHLMSEQGLYMSPGRLLLFSVSPNTKQSTKSFSQASLLPNFDSKFLSFGQTTPAQFYEKNIAFRVLIESLMNPPALCYANYQIHVLYMKRKCPWDTHSKATRTTINLI